MTRVRGSTRRCTRRVLRHMDAAGLAREDGWAPGGDRGRCRRRRWRAVRRLASAASRRPAIARILDRVAAGERLDEADIVALFDARGADFTAVCRAADGCAPSASATPSPTSSTATSTTPTSAPTAASSAPSPRAGTTSAIATSPTTSTWRRSRARTAEAWERGATEVCLQGGIKPELHRRHLPRHRRGGEVGGARHPRARLLAAGDPHRRRDAGAVAPRLPVAPARRRGSPACPARPPRSSTTRCAPSCAPTSSTPPSGSR